MPQPLDYRRLEPKPSSPSLASLAVTFVIEFVINCIIWIVAFFLIILVVSLLKRAG